MSFIVGTAGWSIPPAIADRFLHGSSHLERYAARFPVVEINSSFYRPHRHTTYVRWAATVPNDFRFSIKLPKTITHERRLRDCTSLLERFAEEIGGLGHKRGPVLVQLPPSLAYSADVAEPFFEDLRHFVDVVVLEPRHVSWFEPDVDKMLDGRRIARIAADPAKVPAGSDPGGWKGIGYFRLHGSPDIYASPYEQQAIDDHAARVEALMKNGTEVWTIYDNTMHGAATENALQLLHEPVDGN